MTNAESYLQDVLVVKHRLTKWENDFVDSLVDMGDKMKRKITSKQYNTLRSIAEKYKDTIDAINWMRQSKAMLEVAFDKSNKN